MNGSGKNIYPWAFGMSFLILTGLIALLIFNTYQLEDKNYQVEQVNRIQNAYGAAVMDDKIFPGGNAVFQSELVPCLSVWYQKKLQESADVNAYGYQCMGRFLEQLRRQQSLDSIFRQIVQQQKLDTTLVYLFHFDKLEIYEVKDSTWKVFYESASENRAGAISGKLAKASNNNRVFQLSVSDKNPIAYRFTYSLFVDYENRDWRIFQRMAPVFLLSLACISVIVLLSYRTYKNWVNQRKLADLKTSFLHHIRHEFNTPLTTILVTAHSLIDQAAARDDKEVAQLGRIVERQAKRLKEYFGQVMGTVALQEQQAKLVQVPIDESTQEILDELRLRYGGEIDIVYDPIGDGTELFLDESYYFSILDNMVSNAIKFNDHTQKEIRFAWEKVDSRHFLKITDNGIGIAFTDREAIFTAFYRGHLSGNRPGLGLGLYYVKSCLDRLGWKIHLENPPGGGTIFYIYIDNESFNGKKQA